MQAPNENVVLESALNKINAILEAHDIESVESFIGVEYGHLIKWEIQKSGQKPGWITSITNSASSVISITTDVRYKTILGQVTETVLKSAYAKGKKIAASETGLDAESSSVWSNFNSISKLTDFSAIAKWMESKADNSSKERRKEVISYLEKSSYLGRYISQDDDSEE